MLGKASRHVVQNFAFFLIGRIGREEECLLHRVAPVHCVVRFPTDRAAQFRHVCKDLMQCCGGRGFETETSQWQAFQTIHQIVPDAEQDHPMPALRHAVLFRFQNELAAVARFTGNQRTDRVSQIARLFEILKHHVEDALPVDLRGQETLHILHDEGGGCQPLENADILAIQEMPVIVARDIVRLAHVACPADK